MVIAVNENWFQCDMKNLRQILHKSNVISKAWVDIFANLSLNFGIKKKDTFCTMISADFLCTYTKAINRKFRKLNFGINLTCSFLLEQSLFLFVRAYIIIKKYMRCKDSVNKYFNFIY